MPARGEDWLETSRLYGTKSFHDIPLLNSSSSRTLNAVNLEGSTPWRPKIWIVVRLKPHWGVSGVPFMNSTTGADATALSIAARTSVDSSRVCESCEVMYGCSVECVAPGRREEKTPRRAYSLRGNLVSFEGIVRGLEKGRLYGCSYCSL